MLNKPQRSSLLITVGAVISIPLALAYTNHAIDSRAQPSVEQPKLIPQSVAVTTRHITQHRAKIEFFGEVKPKFVTDIVSQTQGIITRVYPQFKHGESLSKNQGLIKIEDIEYRKLVAQAKTQLAQAQVDYTEQRILAEQAKHNWLQKKQQNPDLAQLQKRPQLTLAENQQQQANIELQAAEIELQKTTVTLPFDGVIMTRHVSLGEYVTTGTPVARVYQDSEMQIELSLTEQQWQQLGITQANKQQLIIAVKNRLGEQFTGIVNELEQHLDSNTRQRSLLVSVEQNQAQKLLPGSFVSVVLQGIPHPQLLKVPSSSVTAQQTIWSVNATDELTEIPVSVSFNQSGWSYLSLPDSHNKDSQSITVVTTPLQSFRSGMPVVAMSSPSVGES